MADFGLFQEKRTKRIKRGKKGKVVRIPVSAFFGRSGAKSVVVKSNYLLTRGTHRGKLLSPRRQMGKISAHINYVGRRALDNTFYNEDGQEVSKEEVWDKIKEKNPFMVHRMVLSPGKDLNKEELHAYVKYELSKLREELPENQNFECFYAKHGGDHPHAHAILYTNNWMMIKKDELQNMREAGNEFMQALERGKILESKQEEALVV